MSKNNSPSGVDNKILEKLKLERQIFPSCIQAPKTYFNKRKSLVLSSKKNKNKSPVFLGEQMDSKKSSHHIQQWLTHQDKVQAVRMPLADVNFNIHDRKHRTEYYNTNKKNYSKENLKNYKRSSHAKISPTRKNNFSLKQQSELTDNRQSLQAVNTKYSVNDESGIVLDDNDSLINEFTAENKTIVIEDSQTEYIDKDKQALLAVIEADENERRIGVQKELLEYSNLDIFRRSLETVNKVNKATKNVPFYKRSTLINCHNLPSDLENRCHNIKQKDIFITIETRDYITNVSIKKDVLGNRKMSAVSVQTDLTDFNLQPQEDTKELSKNNKNTVNLQKRSLVISDSSSDGDDDNNYLQNIHPTSSVFRVRSALAELHDVRLNKFTKRQRISPGSSDSSEKENCDPNRIKKTKTQKCIKKKPFLRTLV